MSVWVKQRLRLLQKNIFILHQTEVGWVWCTDFSFLKNHTLVQVPVCLFFLTTPLDIMDFERRMTALMGRPLKQCTIECVTRLEAGMALCWFKMAVIIFHRPCKQRNTLWNVKSDHVAGNVTRAGNLSHFKYVAPHQLQSDPFFTLTEE